MPRPFRFAVQAMELRDHDGVVSAARQAEDLGYEELYSYDHLGTVDPFIPLVVAAEATTNLRVGPLVINNELHHPALLARTAVTVDRMSGGRLVLGMGTGYDQSEHDAMNIELRSPGRRVERLEECLGALRSLLDIGSVDQQGHHLRLAIPDLGVRPVQDHVPFLVGGHGRRVVGIAGQFADIFQFTGLTHGPGSASPPQPGGFALEDVAARAAWLTEAAGDRDIERSILVQRIHISDNVEETVTQITERLGLPREVVETTPFLLFGSVAQVVERLQQLRETLGISHVVVREIAEFAPVVAALAGR
ncbi:MAG: TIGR03621 family F420-dependent LLM class oxidoreductase [Acidimicrobiaceae bacterium]|nr:TIGR03621 family F420-dependent LLM class oxidoreductase [Acidimicrobiaceae bacterium]